MRLNQARRQLIPLSAAAVVVAAVALSLAAALMPRGSGRADSQELGGASPDLATGLRTLYWAEQTERVGAYFDEVARVDAYLSTVARIDAYLHAAAWLDAASRAAAAEAAEPAVPQPPRAAAARPAARAASAPAPAVMTDAAFASEVFRLLNAERQRAGLPALAVNASLQRSATDYAIRMLQSGTFSHVSPDGTTFGARIVAAGYPSNHWMGEIIATGSGIGPARVVTMWMQSPTHRQQILGNMYTGAGAGCASNGVEIRCVVDFGG